jgi:hypothetical protein
VLCCCLRTPICRASEDDDIPWLGRGAASEREAIDEDAVPSAGGALQGRLHRPGGNAVELDDEGLDERDDEDRHHEVESEGRPGREAREESGSHDAQANSGKTPRMLVYGA